MAEEKSDLECWRDHFQDYILIRNILQTASGREITGYLIVNVAEKRSHIIEDDSINKALAEEMIAAGVRVVSQDEANRILFPRAGRNNRTGESR